MEDSRTRFALSLEDFEKVDRYRRSHKVFLLTMVLSDVVGYTTLCESLAETELMEILRGFESLTSRHFEERRGGLIVKRIGDAALVVFAEPVSAVLAALDLHEELKNTLFSGVKLQARTGIHMGQVTLEKSGIHVDIFGRHVNRVARVQAAAEPEEILVTDSVEDNVRAWLNSERSIHIFRRKILHLKGIDNPVTVFTVSFGTDDQPVAESPLPEAYITIKLVSSEDQGKVMTFDPAHDRRILIGRGEECDISLPRDKFFSRKHAMILYDRDSGDWLLQDLGSTNGIFLNGERVDREVLKPGHRIQGGQVIIEIADMRSGKREPIHA
jgi:class 3 adenylate cyclase